MASPKIVLDDDERFALMKFRRKVADVTQPHHDDVFLVRWLLARSWNVDAAEKMLRESLKWRAFWEVDTKIKTTWELPEPLALSYPSGTTGCDSEGCPVLFLPFAGFDVVGALHSVSQQDVVRMIIKLLEMHLEEAKRAGGNKVVAVFDMAGFVLKDYAWKPAAELIISLLKMYEANYPEILKRCYVINAPAIFAVAFSLVKRCLNEYTISKISIYKSDPKKWKKVLRENIPVEILPKYYGGDLVDADGDPKCSSQIRQGCKIPKSYYKNKFNNEDGTFTSTVVKKGKKFHQDFIVAEEGCILKWEFRTDRYDIKFGITCLDQDGNVTTEIDSHRVSSHHDTENGVLECQAPATYTVTFDNTYSLFRSKKLHYNIIVSASVNKVEMIEPETANGINEL